jgi:hypothetical protein
MATALHRLLRFEAAADDSKRDAIPGDDARGQPTVPGYGEGMTQLAAFVLLAFKDKGSSSGSAGGGGEAAEEARRAADADAEEDAFWTLAATVKFRLAPYYAPGTAAAQQLETDAAHLTALVAARAPAVAARLAALEFEWAPLLSEWRRSFYFDAIPPHCALHVGDLALFHTDAAAVLLWVAQGLACGGDDAPLARCASCPEAGLAMRTAALELKHLGELDSSSSGGFTLAEVAKRLEVAGAAAR